MSATIALLRERMESVRALAALRDSRADEEWDSYKRHADAARALWSEHAELQVAISTLEQAEARSLEPSDTHRGGAE